MSRRWQCTVCGYIHVGTEPPESCPVCGADRSQFVPLEDQQAAALPSLIATFKLHPVAAHFPNGLLPTAALFLLLYLVRGNPGFEATAFWLLIGATAVVPVSLGSGLHDWRQRFGGRRAPIFFKKIGLALTLLTLGLVAVAVRYGQPELLATGGWQRWLYLVCLGGMLGCVMLLGHYGSILVVQGAGETKAAGTLLPGRTADEWSRTIVAQAADAILAADASGTIRLWNQGAERIFGVPANQAIGQSLDLIIPESLRQRHWEGWAKVMRSGESRYGTEMLRVPALRGDGRRFSAEFSIVMRKDDAGKVTGVAAILRDVSEQWEREKQSQAQLTACRALQREEAMKEKAMKEEDMKRTLLGPAKTVLLILLLTTGCMLWAAPAVAGTAAEIDREVGVALVKLHAAAPAAIELTKVAKGILVFPNVIKAGLVVGGQYGEGALLVEGKTVAYYNTIAASYGLQAGAQSFGYAMFLMTDEAMDYLKKSEGWEVGVGPTVVVMDEGMAKSLTSSTAKEDIYAFTFGQKGLMAGIGLQGSKITKITPGQ